MSGFSLIELIAVMVIVSISLCLAFPNITLILDKRNAHSQANELTNFLREAKSLAARRNQRLVMDILLSGPSGQPWSLQLHPEGNTVNLLLFFEGEDDFSLRSNFPNNQIIMDGVKEKVSSGTLIIERKRDSIPLFKVISAYSAGRIRLCSIGEKFNATPLC